MLYSTRLSALKRQVLLRSHLVDETTNHGTHNRAKKWRHRIKSHGTISSHVSTDGIRREAKTYLAICLLSHRSLTEPPATLKKAEPVKPCRKRKTSTTAAKETRMRSGLHQPPTVRTYVRGEGDGEDEDEHEEVGRHVDRIPSVDFAQRSNEHRTQSKPENEQRDGENRDRMGSVEFLRELCFCEGRLK